MNNEGIVLDPEIDDALDAEYDPNNPANRDYFSNAATEENIQRIFAGVNQGKSINLAEGWRIIVHCTHLLSSNLKPLIIVVGCGDNGGVEDDYELDDGASEFEFRAKNMDDILDDGGVKKKVIN